MRKQSAAAFILACTSAIGASQNALAQSPPSADPNLLIWSDRDLSLRPGGFAPAPETETTPQLPHVGIPDGFFAGSPEQVLICDPGQLDFVAAITAAYAQAGKQQVEQAR
jgi:hypothetical protein